MQLRTPTPPNSTATGQLYLHDLPDALMRMSREEVDAIFALVGAEKIERDIAGKPRAEARKVLGIYPLDAYEGQLR